MSNEYFQPGSVPAPNSPGSSAVMRNELASIASGFDKLPPLAGNGNRLVAVDPAGTRLITASFNLNEIVTLTGIQTITNKTISWVDNNFPGFGNAATRDAGLLAGNVLLLSANNQLPAMDGSLLTNLNITSILGVIPITKGGTGASTLPTAQAALGIDLKANINSPSFTGTPTAPTPGLGDSSARIATTFFVTNVLDTIGAVTPGDALPIMDGTASAGTPGAFLVSRVDHVHPTDTSRAPASAATAARTSLTPVGGVATTDVQAGIQELDAEKAPLASPAFTGTPTAPTPPIQDTSTRLATTQWVQSELAAIPPAGMYPSNDIPLMAGIGAAGTAVEGARGDHRHPTDTTRAPLASPALTGNPLAPTPAPGDNSTSIATTAFVTGGHVAKTGANGAAVIPAGTDAQRPTGANGLFRYNSQQNIFEGYTPNGWGQVGGGQMYGAAAVKAIFYNAQVIAENIDVLAGQNGLSAGPVTVADGFTVTVANGSTWTVV